MGAEGGVPGLGVASDPVALAALLDRWQREATSGPAGARAAQPAAPPVPPSAATGGVEEATTSIGGGAFQQGLWSGALKAEWPAFGSQPGGAPSAAATPKPDMASKVMADARVRLSESLAKTHGLDTEASVRAACDPYLAELATRLGDPAYVAFYDDALEARAGALDRVRELEADREMRAIEGELRAIEHAAAAERMAGQVAPLKVPVPPGLGALPAPHLVSDHLDAITKVGSFLLDLGPGVGSVKLATEAVTGRDVMGAGAKLSDDERLLRAALVAAPAVGSLVLRGAAKAAPAVAALAARTGRSSGEVLSALRSLRVLGPEAKALEGALAKRAAGQALTRDEAVLLRRAAAKVEGLRAGGPLKQAQKRVNHLDRVEARAAAKRGESVSASEGGGLRSDLLHVEQRHPVSCGPACGEIAAGHHARAAPGSWFASEATLMMHPEFNAELGGMHGAGLAAALEREAPVVGRGWKSTDPLGATRTAERVQAGLENALREGNGVAIVNTIVNRGQSGEFMHWVVVRKVEGNRVIIHDPLLKTPTVETISSAGFGKYHWFGDTVVAAAKSR